MSYLKKVNKSHLEKYHLDFDKFDKTIHKLLENYPDADQKLQKYWPRTAPS